MARSTPIQNENRTTIKLKTRASRTRERTEELIEVASPRTREGQMNQLIELVQERFPGAELRVFHDGAGSFTRDDLHVVAVYTKDPLPKPSDHRRAVDDRGGEDGATSQLRLTA